MDTRCTRSQENGVEPCDLRRPLLVDSILQAPHAALLKTLLETPNMEKAAKAAALLALWRSWLKKLSAEGACMDSVLLKSLGAVQDALLKEAPHRDVWSPGCQLGAGGPREMFWEIVKGIQHIQTDP